jgi:hypothetical protein
MSYLSSTITAVNSLSVVGTRPAGATAAHILTAVLLRNGNVTSGFSTASAGWTLRSQLEGVAFPAQIQVWTALGDVAGLTFTTPGATNSDLKLALVASAGRNLAPVVTVGTPVESTSTSIAASSMTAAGAEDAIVAWMDTQSGTSIGSAPAGYTDIVNDATTAIHFVIAIRDNLSLGATGALSRTATNFNMKLASGILLADSSGGGATIPMGQRIFVNG